MDYKKMKQDELITFASLALGIGAIMWLYSSGRGSRNSNNNMNTDIKTPRGYRNNNPLNIRYNAANNWQGKVAQNTDGVFEQFVAMEYGYRAALKLIRNYITKDNLFTVTDVISKWAPPTENNTAGYIQRVIGMNQWTASKVIDPYSKDDMCDLVYAMAIVENGNTILPSYTEIYKGWGML